MINKKQKIISIIIAVLMIASCWFLTPCKTAYAATSGDFEYTVSGGQATITGYTGNDAAISIPPVINGYPVVAIGEYAFYAAGDLRQVSLPNSVRKVGGHAFESCSYLLSMTLPNGITEIGESAFSYCSSLNGINIPEGVTRIEKQTFIGTGITNIRLPQNIVNIGENAFNGCRALTQIKIPEKVIQIDSYAFSDTAINEVYIYGNAPLLGEYSFDYDKNNVTVYYSKDKTGYTNPWHGYTTIGLNPNKMPAFDEPGFSGISGDFSYWISNGKAKITEYMGKNSSVNIPSSVGGYPVREIGIRAFYNDTNIINVTIPEGVIHIGVHAFMGCNHLKSISIPDSVSQIDFQAFCQCESLKSVDLPNSLTEISGSLFEYCPSLESVSIPDGVTRIGASAFSYSALKSVTIPASVVSISNSAFAASISLEGAYFCGNAPKMGDPMDGSIGDLDGAFDGCKKGFTVYYLPEVTGFTNPWYGYPTKALTSVPVVSYQTHVQDIGWQGWKTNGEIAGTSGQSLRLEGMNIEIDGMPDSIEYRTHVQDIGWQGWVRDGEMTGTSGRALRLEAIEIRLTGYMAANYDIYYRVHAQNIGWMDWAKNGQSAGTAGLSYRLEAIQIKLVPKGGAAPGSTAMPFKDANGSAGASVKYQTHIQDVGWQGWKSNGEVAGTSGQLLRLEGMYIDIEGADNAIEYRTHVQDIGWQGWVRDGEMTGTSGCALRLEAIEIRLKGDMAANYDIYYRVHAQNIGWMDWAKNGQSAGTAGLSYRLEAIQIVIVQKDGAAPGATARPFVSA